MIELFPQGIGMIDQHGRYPLYQALFLRDHCSSTVVLKLIELFPKEAEIVASQRFSWHYYYYSDGCYRSLYPIQVALLKYKKLDRHYKSVVFKLMELCPKICAELCSKDIHAMDNDMHKLYFDYKQIYGPNQSKVVF